jgi:hypothetical protein
MGMEYEAAMDGFIGFVLANFPQAEVGEDNDGQLIIYTNLHQDPETGQIVPFKES